MASEVTIRVAALRKAALAAKLLIHPVNDGGYMVLRGSVRVKWNPRTLRCNVDGQGIGWKERDPEQVIWAAINGPPFIAKGEAEKNRKVMTARRLRMWKKKPSCHWCLRRLEFDESTVDHRIPLARGGSNNPNNLVLSCVKCNADRGPHVGTPQQVSERRAMILAAREPEHEEEDSNAT